MRALKSLCCVWVLVSMPSNSQAGSIEVTLTPENSMVAQGQEITVPVEIDVSSIPEKLGSYTAQLSWDANVLKYVRHSSGTTEGFTNPLVNVGKSAEGKILFAAANPYGAEGKINVLNVVFEVVGEEGTDAGIELEVTAMSAARTFTNLLPYVHVSKMVGAFRVTELPKKFALSQNHPNPFNPSTQIGYDLPKDAHVVIKIYNLRGQVVKILVDERKEAGGHSIVWSGQDEAGREVPVGIYLYHIRADHFSDSKKMLLVR